MNNKENKNIFQIIDYVVPYKENFINSLKVLE